MKAQANRPFPAAAGPSPRSVLSVVLPWLILAVIVLMPVILRIWGEDGPDNGVVHHSDDGEPEQDPELPLAV